MADISKTYNLKNYKNMVIPYGPLDVNLGFHKQRHRVSEDNSDSFWYAISSTHYVNNVIYNI